MEYLLHVMYVVYPVHPVQPDRTHNLLSRSLARRQTSFNILLPSYIITVYRATTLKDGAYSHRRNMRDNRSTSTTHVT